MYPNSNQIYDALTPYYRHYSEKKSKYLTAIDKLVLKNIPAKTKRILDVGCGDGVRGNHLFSQINASEFWMIDSSPNMYHSAKRFIANNVKILQFDISKQKQGEKLPTEYFDVVLCLWNVLGHITEYPKRLQALTNIKNILKRKGKILIDVSNRYNITYYGWKLVLKNIWDDIVKPDPHNGTALYKIKVPNKEINSYCHFFNPKEIPFMCKKLNLKILGSIYVDYHTGAIANRWSGHIFYVIEKS